LVISSKLLFPRRKVSVNPWFGGDRIEHVSVRGQVAVSSTSLFGVWSTSLFDQEAASSTFVFGK
jgi:hypothetical protein